MKVVDTFAYPSFSLRNRLTRVLWNICCLLFFRYTPIPLHAWRSFVLRIFGARVGKGVHVYPRVKIWGPWNLDLRDQCGIGNGAILYSQAMITIGERAIISQGSHICTGTHDYTKKENPLVTAPISIGAMAWVAAESFVHPGLTIGDGCVVGARSVVTKDLPPWTVCAGHPCKVIKERVMSETAIAESI